MAFFVAMGAGQIICGPASDLLGRRRPIFVALTLFAIGSSQWTGRLGKCLGLARLVRTAIVGFAAAMLLQVLLNLLGIDRLVPMLVLLFIGFGFLGLVMPATAVLALDRHGPIAGTASALMGMLQFLTGALVIAAVGQFVDGSSRPMVAGIGACALRVQVISYRTLAKTPARTAPI